MHSFERENKRYFTRLQAKFEGKAQSLTPYTITAEFNDERITGLTWSTARGHVVYLELTQ
jgi:hypothetical protein